MSETLESLIQRVQQCRICEKHLPLGPRPVLSAHPDSKVLIIGQAPGTRVHATGIPWNDPSGDELRRWLAVDRDTFYDPKIFGIIPMGFCYLGRGKGGDLPPRKECAPAWHEPLRQHLPKLKLTLLIGSYAQAYYLGVQRKSTLTETVLNFESYLPQFLPLVHPSPRNRLWMRRNPWFEETVVPRLRQLVWELIGRKEE
ncbi:uracil-DNA glycosylase family protein [Algoriphagus aestuariicola]|uniref:Uracil-DNA glycosylase family protein n=1 Tax=Algoriphagus aestuariicola TaxID=1852016 RepID=A0ABS3BMC1_9BACT|nr:uracil-DNA glycosylase family protein [Algoriphagus aestuariicola]MBN7800210.1 uracil-DNA glycosylase family protein [Algoriphagus aestuariicola]